MHICRCPICKEESTIGKNKYCPKCEWDLTEYSLSPKGLEEEQESKIKWAKRMLEDNQRYINKIERLEEELERVKERAELLQTEESFNRLIYWLKTREWKKADIETGLIMLSAMHKTQSGVLEDEDIENFPSAKLKEIDDLWIKYSNRRFGFSIQKYIYENLDKTRNDKWLSFCRRVGWCEGYNCPEYSQEELDRYTKNDKGLTIKMPDIRMWRYGYIHDTCSFSPFAPPGHLPLLRAGKINNAHFNVRFTKLLNSLSLTDNLDPGGHFYFPPIRGKPIFLPDKNLQQDFKLTLNELTFGCTKRVSFKRQEACQDCLGTGFKPILCQSCNGLGTKLDCVDMLIKIPPEGKGSLSRFDDPQIEIDKTKNCLIYKKRGEGHVGEYGGLRGDLSITFSIFNESPARS